MQTVSLSQSARNFWTVLSNPRFMVFLLIFSGYWVVFWQEFIILPLYIHDYIDPKANTELLLVTGPLTVIALQLLVSFLTQRIPAFRAITLGTLISGLACTYSDRASHCSYGGADPACRFSGRNHPVAALLRIHFATCSAGTARHLHGICLLADRNRIHRRRLVRRTTGPSLWRSDTPTRTYLVARGSGRRGYRWTLVDL